MKKAHPAYLQSPLNRFVSDQKGVSAIEYAFIAPILIWLIMWIIEYGLIVVVSSMLSHAANEAGRRAKTGAMYGTSDPTVRAREDMVRQTVIDLMGDWIRKPSDISVDSTPRGVMRDPSVINLGASGQIIDIRVTYRWETLTPALKYTIPGYGKSRQIGNDEVALIAHVLVKNESF